MPLVYRSKSGIGGRSVKAFSALKGHYVKIPNELLNDPNISFKAKGLYCHMASKPDTFNFTSRSLASQFPEGKAAILSAMDELKDRGWMNYIQHPSVTGKYTLNTTLKPALTPQLDNQTEQEPKPDNRDPENRMLRKSGRINKKDFNNKKDVYKGEDEKEDVLLPSKDGDPFGSSTRFTTEEILELILKGVINID